MGQKITIQIGTQITQILHFGIHCDTNGCTDGTDFTDAVRIFF
jgi:hypothetical protein